MTFDDLDDFYKNEVSQLRKLLYRAVMELEYVQNFGSVDDLTASAEGQAIVNEGMKLLGVADLSSEELPLRLVKA